MRPKTNRFKLAGVIQGPQGDSAYEVAVKEGFEGTKEEWLASLRYDHSDEFSKIVDQVKEAGTTATSDISKLATSTKQDITNTGETVKTEIAQVSTDEIGKVTKEGDDQVQKIEEKGQEVVNSIPGDFTTQMDSKLDKQQGAENAGKLLGVDKDGNVAPSEFKGRKLLAKYIHKANGSMKISDLDLQTGTFTTSEPHGLKENTSLYIKPLAYCVPKHIPIEIYRNNKGQWGRGNIYAHVIDEFNFQILSKKDGDILLFTDDNNKEVNINNFTFEYSMKNITLTNINSKHIEVIANGICSGGYYAIEVIDSNNRLHSSRYASGKYSLLNVGQVPAHFTYSCHMSFDRGNVISTIPLNTKAIDGTNYAVNQTGLYPKLVVYTSQVLAIGNEYNPNETYKDGYIVKIKPFSNEVLPFNDSYVEIWGYDE